MGILAGCVHLSRRPSPRETGWTSAAREFLICPLSLLAVPLLACQAALETFALIQQVNVALREALPSPTLGLGHLNETSDSGVGVARQI